ncbi:putative divalent ion tolerance protein [Actinacidiphila reveromycinica]|uniref:Putative divalent ion tolerance protein n=1 Tax=Actinacidiphila reveromycinica TaxID=659352 RepID=A0A7U3USX6_9ACTN|nr:divalent-cation tolerance protein CutA [Streptomyces sp. SN-593]BBA98159.1 putative divalent ion tolerance protein [Streptomyces sp. SN-593]
MTDFVQVFTATETREQAVQLAEAVVRARLAAGAQVVGPVTAVFWHLGEFGTGEEWQLLLKTTVERYPALEEHLVAQHPWDKPEVVAVPITAGSPPYLRWVEDSTSPGRNP